MLNGASQTGPFFTIAVPTYNRHEMLREALGTVLTQDFADFEVLIGNDYTAERLDGDTIGITDPRVRFVNHPRNLREVGNMNALLELARGRYFTWLFDDDLYEPGFLGTAHESLVQTGFPPAFFASFRMLKVKERYQPRKIDPGPLTEFTGAEFLRWYCPRRPQVASTAGLFDTAQLRSVVGGFEELSPSAVGLYSEFLFLVRCGLLERIVFLDAPLYVFRRHAESYSEGNRDLENHLMAGRELVRRSAAVLRHRSLVQDGPQSLRKICAIHLVTFAYKTARIEFARSRFGLGTLLRAASRHWREYRATRQQYAGEMGKPGVIDTLSLLFTVLYAQYIMLRLLNYFRTLSRG